MFRWVRLLAFVSVLLPSAWYAWHWRAMPHAGYYHDDGIYYVTAQTLAAQGDYTIASLPFPPPQTKYPPLWPWVLSIAWRIAPQFPDNLPWAMLLTWIWLPVSLAAYRLLLRETEPSSNLVLLLCAFWALNPYVVLFSTTLLSEILFTALLLLSLVLLRRESPIWTAGAAALAGFAYLTRSAGLAILPGVVLWLLLRRDWKRAAVYSAVFVPFVAGWMLWSQQHRTPGTGEIALYYTNYFGYHLSVVEWRELYLYLWKNLDGVLHGLGALMLPDVTLSFIDKALAVTIGVAGVAGVVRLAREHSKTVLAPYALFAAFYCLLLVIWHFPPNERFVLPMAPLWIHGLWREMSEVVRNIGAVFRKPQAGQRIAGGVMLFLIASVLLTCGWRQWDLLSTGMSSYFEDQERRLRDAAPVMQWMRKNLPPDATVLSELDPMTYLRTGRRGAGYILTTIHWYRDDQNARAQAYGNAAAYCRRHGLQYIVLNEWDYSRDFPAEVHERILKSMRSDPNLELQFRSGPTAIYRVR